MSMHIFVSDNPKLRHWTGEPVELLYVVHPFNVIMVETTTGQRFAALRSELEFWYQCP